MLGGAAAGRAPHEHAHPALPRGGRARVGGGGGGGPGGPGVALRQQDPHAVHAVAVTALQGKRAILYNINNYIISISKATLSLFALLSSLHPDIRDIRISIEIQYIVMY